MSSNEQSAWHERVEQIIKSEIFNPELSVKWLAKKANISERQFSRKVNHHCGKSPGKLIQEGKLKMAYQMLESPNPPMVREVAARLHFTDTKYFSRLFWQHFQVYPSQVNRLP